MVADSQRYSPFTSPKTLLSDVSTVSLTPLSHDQQFFYTTVLSRSWVVPLIMLSQTSLSHCYHRWVDCSNLMRLLHIFFEDITKPNHFGWTNCYSEAQKNWGGAEIFFDSAVSLRPPSQLRIRISWRIRSCLRKYFRGCGTVARRKMFEEEKPNGEKSPGTVALKDSASTATSYTATKPTWANSFLDRLCSTRC